jgi:flagellar biosynthesis/type III secretory pathway protein FliH
MDTTQSYRFPSLAEFNPALIRPARRLSRIDEAAVSEAIARGYAEGRASGNAEAEKHGELAYKTARSEGLAAGHGEGLTAMQSAGEALGAALKEFNQQRASLTQECEQFCVDLTLAIVSRIVEASPVRAEFVTREIRNALKLLAPEPATAIFLNPDDHKLTAESLADLPLKADDTLTSGHARVETGRLVVEAGIEPAFAQIKSAVLEVKRARNQQTSTGSQGRARKSTKAKK